MGKNNIPLGTICTLEKNDWLVFKLEAITPNGYPCSHHVVYHGEPSDTDCVGVIGYTDQYCEATDEQKEMWLRYFDKNVMPTQDEVKEWELYFQHLGGKGEIIQKPLKCICEVLRDGSAKSVQIVDYSTGPYINLTMELGSISAHGEDNASAGINYCPFCGRKFNLIQV